MTLDPEFTDLSLALQLNYPEPIRRQEPVDWLLVFPVRHSSHLIFFRFSKQAQELNVVFMAISGPQKSWKKRNIVYPALAWRNPLPSLPSCAWQHQKPQIGAASKEIDDSNVGMDGSTVFGEP